MIDRYAVLGNPVGHSQSPAIHALFAAQTGQRLSYEAILAPRDGFAETLRRFIAAGGRGANVTVPFKEEAWRLCDRRSSRAEAAGAVNTLSFVAGRIEGDNTDGAGLVRDITVNLGLAIRDHCVVLLGAGGAARGVILPLLLEEPAALVIANRTKDKALRLAAEFAALPGCAVGVRVSGCGLSDLSGHACDTVINATSAGLAGASLGLPDGLMAPGVLAYDLVYGRETPFMAAARTAGARVAGGLGMLVEQAAESFFLWRGLRPETAPVLAQLRGAGAP